MKDRIQFPKNTTVHIGGVPFTFEKETMVMGDAKSLDSVNIDCIKDLNKKEPVIKRHWTIKLLILVISTLPGIGVLFYNPIDYVVGYLMGAFAYMAIMIAFSIPKKGLFELWKNRNEDSFFYSYYGTSTYERYIRYRNTKVKGVSLEAKP